ncbi:sugar transferase [Arcticibacter eurypsychrophilus]|uniref:sugar transferase n=1 Tax=Arcticibacter eurypsychrophilus TaxID=1434752 RepID=UPI00084DCDB9|nr:sugar transferase [Arcticibacter eurypsychrophilus]
MSSKRIFDVLVSLLGIILLIPLFLLVSICIMINSKGGVLYRQTRIGRNSAAFSLLKFRTMRIGADQTGELTIGFRDSRITPCGYFLRKYKIDELPQLFNILTGEMSFVGPRPEVSKYVNLYNLQQQRVLSVKPGITDWASITYINENQLLATSANPETFYIEQVIPDKIKQNLKYVDHHNLWIDMKIILLTIKNIVFNR